MPAFMIIQARLSKPEKFAAYAREAAKLVARFGGRYRALGTSAETLEGAAGADGKWVISEWPDVESARAFWNSPEYQRAKALRAGCGEFVVTLVDGQSSRPEQKTE